MYKTKTAIATLGLLITLLTSNFAQAGLPELGDPTLSSFSQKDEAELGLAFYRSLRANLTFIDDLQINDYLTNLGNRLASHSDAAGKTFHFFVIEAPTINAFAGPAGYIGVHSKLILDAKNESELAGVMAHEIAHVSQRHLARAFDKAGNSTALTLATLLAAILVGTQDIQASQAVLLSGIAGAQQSSINFTRSNEQEADRIGINILASSGINPEGMADFFETLLNHNPDNGMEYLRTHPLNANRISDAKDRIKKQDLKLPSDSVDFELFKARLIILLSKDPEKYLKDNMLSKGLVPQYEKALAAIKVHQPQSAIQILKQLIKKNDHPWLKLALAEAYQADNDDVNTLKELEKLEKLYPGYLPVTMAYARTLNDNNMPEKSIPLLKKQLQSDDRAIIYQALANAYYANGQIGAALEATGDQYARQGYFELAIQQYDNALKQSDIGSSTRQRLEAAKADMKKAMKQFKDTY
jgi:predicted Zn-dependent protease